MSIIVAFAACIVGILISFYIYIKKKKHQALLCPRDNPCDIVLHSRYGSTFGIPNEVLGFCYFVFVSVLLFLFISAPIASSGALLYTLFFTLLTGGLFSLYLIGLQAVVIRSWCFWCLGIALANIVLIVSLIGLPFASLAPMLKTQRLWWVIVHNLGFILGVGSATLTDIFFFRFLKDNIITQEEKETMDALTGVIWAGLAILIVSGVALYIPEAARLNISSKFLLKGVVVLIIAINGVLLNMFVSPKLRRLSFEGTLPAKHFRRLAFALGGISLSSWYTAFILGSLRKIHFDFQTALLGYGALLILVVIGSQIAERIVMRTRQKAISIQNS